jgi:hypothetical protein
MRRLADLRTLLFVAGEAGFALGALVTYGVFGNVNLVAGGAGYITRLVDAAFPLVVLAILGVAGLACAISGIGRGSCFGVESYVRLGRLAATGVAKVVQAGTVTACACGGACIGLGAVAGLAYGQKGRRIGIVVAGGTRRVAFKNKVFRRIRTVDRSPYCKPTEAYAGCY